eukprot:scaffold75_cov217-Pinguiococcus_pyrenoidosus.AAC.18
MHCVDNALFRASERPQAPAARYWTHPLSCGDLPPFGALAKDVSLLPSAVAASSKQPEMQHRSSSQPASVELARQLAKQTNKEKSGRTQSRKGHAILRQVRAAEKFEQFLQGNPSDPDKLAAGCDRCCDKPDREEYPDVLPRTLIKEQPSRLLN